MDFPLVYTATEIGDIRVTPIAFYDPPLLNNAGCHQPFALRSVIELETDGSVIGLGERYGEPGFIEGIKAVAPGMRGRDVTDLNGPWAATKTAIEDVSER